MDLHYRQEVTVGLLVIVAVTVLFGGLTWLSGKSLGGAGKTLFPVRFENVSGLNEGDPVQISGVRVGRVAGIDLRGVNEVVVTLEVNATVRPRVDARAEVRALDAFGGMFVDYRPGTSDQLLSAGQVLAGQREPPLMETAGNLANRAGGVLTGVETILSQHTADEIRATMRAAQRALNVMAQLGSGPMVTEATSALERLASAAQRLDSTLASPDLVRSVAQLDEITANLEEMTGGLATATQALGGVLERIEDDRGTLGRLVNDTALYHELVELARSMRVLLDDVRERPGRYVNIKIF